MNTEFPGRGKVAVLRTKPETVLEDYARLMALAGFEEALPKDKDTILKINISWQTWYPACSTAPNNKHKYVVEKYGVRNVHLYEPQYNWVRYTPKQPFLVLDKIYPEGVYIPELLIGRNIIQLPTVKTHVFTVITGAMKNAFGGLLNTRRHWTHSVIHETLVDLLMIQQDIHPGLFAVMDGTFAGDGPGPRAMRWHEKDVLLASADQVAIDAISAHLQGFDPLTIPFIRIAHEMGLGVGDPDQIEIVGEDPEWVRAQNWGFIQEDTFASRGQKLIYHGWLHPLEPLLLRSPLVPWSYFASNQDRPRGSSWDGGVGPGYGAGSLPRQAASSMRAPKMTRVRFTSVGKWATLSQVAIFRCKTLSDCRIVFLNEWGMGHRFTRKNTDCIHSIPEIRVHPCPKWGFSLLYNTSNHHHNYSGGFL